MKFFSIAALALLCYSCNRKTSLERNMQMRSVYNDAAGNPVLLGIHTAKDLQQAPYNEWFNKNKDLYKIDSATADKFKLLVKDKKFEIFMGTWCGDSKREIPRIFKLLEYSGVRASQLTMVMLDNRDSVYKQSPGHEEKDKAIHRVPTLIVYDGKKEMNRIVEVPVISLERDLLLILTGQQYEPSYEAATYLLNLTASKQLAVIKQDSGAIISILKNLSRNSAELNSLGYVWMAAGNMDKAWLAFDFNAALYPKNANVYDSLGEMYIRRNNKAAARVNYNKVLLLDPGNAHAAKMLAILQ
ncbi:MAG: hypothetical protein ABIU63_18520 [Chitinophagaceae bacterium]